MKSIFNISQVYRLIIMLLLALWLPVAIDKILDFAAFRSGILNQPFPDLLGYILIYLLPVLEIATVATLVVSRLQKLGLIMSTTLLIVFSTYIAIALLGAWEQLPCGCGSVINGMNWKQHLIFNLIFLIISIWGLYLWNKLRGSKVGDDTVAGGSAKRRL
ncbi:MAG: MauE/DoxX family redox-associated membrane protein [Sphingobacterium hotanense]